MTRRVDPEALLCALVLAPATYSRNRFFEMYQHVEARSVRRRAAYVRGVIRQLLGRGLPRARVVGEQVLRDGRVLLRYDIPEVKFSRAIALSALEAAILRYALHQAGAGPLASEEKRLVEDSIRRLGDGLNLGTDSLDSVAPTSRPLH